MDLFGIGKIADALKSAEWIGAIFAGLAWAFGHPSTAAWVLGGVFILAVFRKAWPFANVPNIDAPLGKLIVGVGAFLVVGGFAWRAVDEVVSKLPAKAAAVIVHPEITNPAMRAEQNLPPIIVPQSQRALKPSDGG